MRRCGLIAVYVFIVFSGCILISSLSTQSLLVYQFHFFFYFNWSAGNVKYFFWHRLKCPRWNAVPYSKYHPFLAWYIFMQIFQNSDGQSLPLWLQNFGYRWFHQEFCQMSMIDLKRTNTSNIIARMDERRLLKVHVSRIYEEKRRVQRENKWLNLLRSWCISERCIWCHENRFHSLSKKLFGCGASTIVLGRGTKTWLAGKHCYLESCFASGKFLRMLYD